MGPEFLKQKVPVFPKLFLNGHRVPILIPVFLKGLLKEFLFLKGSFSFYSGVLERVFDFLKGFLSEYS